MTVEKLKIYLLNKYDPDDIVFLLNLSTEDLLDKFGEVLEDKYVKLALEIEESEEEETHIE